MKLYPQLWRTLTTKTRELNNLPHIVDPAQDLMRSQVNGEGREVHMELLNEWIIPLDFWLRLKAVYQIGPSIYG